MDIRKLYQEDAVQSELLPSNTSFLSVDLQKVKMLPEIPGIKSAVFTSRIACYNERFSPLGKGNGSNSRALLWYQGMQNRNDEDITSAYLRLINEEEYHKRPNFVLWMDNCSSQNKHWTLFSVLVAYMRHLPATSWLETITLKYFEPGHTFMSADSFHAQVEKQFKRKPKLFDFNGYVSCVAVAGRVIKMQEEDFFCFESGLSEKIQSKASRPLLSDVYVVQVRRDDISLYFKTDPLADEFYSTDFLKLKIMKLIKDRTYFNSVSVKPVCGTKASRKSGILTKLCTLMPQSKRLFWENLPANDSLEDNVQEG